MKEDRVTDEQVRGVTGQVNKLTSRRVNRLLGIEDKVTDEQVRGVTERGEWAGDGKETGGENGSHVRGRSILS